MASASASAAAAGSATARNQKHSRGPIAISDEAGLLPFAAIQSGVMANLGFLGLGLMGYPMARNLLRAGHRVALWSNTAEKAHKLAAEEKGIACQTPKEVAEQADTIFLCVGNSQMSEETILGDEGIIQGVKPGSVVA